MGCCCSKTKEDKEQDNELNKRDLRTSGSKGKESVKNAKTNGGANQIDKLGPKVNTTLAFESVKVHEKQEILDSLDDNPNDTTAMANYSIILAKEGKMKEAQDLLTKAIEIDKENSRVWQCYAELYERQNNITKAQEIYNQGYKFASPKIALGDDDSNLMLNYAISLQKSKNYDKAEKLYKRAVTSGPGNPETAGRYGSFLLEIREDIDRASQYLKQAADFTPPHRGWCEYYAKFLKDYEKNDQESTKYQKRATLYVASPSTD
ncbi:hypothetical protein CYY_006187 [Polysphondylium violaceum]|uniref:TPR repeat-containing protein n=1 Tax=Polysphondylium violaceum TaxID=133409 RepID=A0A8J4PT23_9MYCE|nr:hypothetical protein CYY_006187 [Polysphondylium violaceum]